MVTDRRRLCPNGTPEEARECLLAQARAAVEAGVDVFQIRERDLGGLALSSLTFEIVRLAKSTRTRVVINDRLDVALACGATGMHLRADSVSAGVVRSIAPQGFLIGRSVHSPAEARALGDGVDYLVAGTVWETPSKSPEHPTLGLEGLAEIVRLASVPVIGIGGVTLDRLEALAGTGAAGAAAIGMFMGPEGGRDDACRAVPLSSLIDEARARFDRVELT